MKIKSTITLLGLALLLVACNSASRDLAKESYKSDIREEATEGTAEESEVAAVPQVQQIAVGANQVNQERKASSEQYDIINDNTFKLVSENPLSTFSIDVDAASYSNVRRFINNGQLPPPDAVRIEELINYFTYNYPQPKDNKPFSLTTEVTNAPWNPDHKLVQIGLQGKRISTEELPSSNLVFLFDVSGSMAEPNKLPLLKSAFRLLVNQLDETDRVSIVVYAGAAGVVLPPTPGDEKDKILAALEELQAGGSTAGGDGIQKAYKLAEDNFIKNGNNRVILATDGDFNVGIASDADLVSLIQEKRQAGVFLTILGFGTGNFQDGKMEKLSNHGNGNYAYIDDVAEAQKVLVKEMGGTLLTIAKDVKIQVEFTNPLLVESYRLVGYENRLLNDRDFDDDTKDAGELGAGHSVTALYEIVPTKKAAKNPGLMQVNLRYKLPKEDTSQLITRNVWDENTSFNEASEDLRFAAAVASFGMVLRNSPYKGNMDLNQVLELAKNSQGTDLDGYRGEFVDLVKKTEGLK